MPVTFIYALVDPRSQGDLRYVGKTVSSLRDRLGEHLREVRRARSKNHRQCWLAALLNAQIQPNIVLLESVEESGDWVAREQHWIRALRAAGHRLTNSTLGGEGATGHRPSAETRAKMAAAHKGNKFALGLRHSAESIEKMRIAHTGRKFTVEHREKIGRARIGKKRPPFSPEWKANLSVGIRGKKRPPLTLQHKEKLRLATLAHYADKCVTSAAL